MFQHSAFLCANSIRELYIDIEGTLSFVFLNKKLFCYGSALELLSIKKLFQDVDASVLVFGYIAVPRKKPPWNFKHNLTS